MLRGPAGKPLFGSGSGRTGLEAARTVERGLNANPSDYVGPTVACACGQAARYAGRRPKTFLSVLGPLTLERACCHCDACHAGICVRDRALGLEGASLTPATMRMVGLAAAEVGYRHHSCCDTR